MELNEIKELVELFDSTQITKLYLQQGDYCLKLEKGGATKAEAQSMPVAEQKTPVCTPATHTSEQQTSAKGESITSPMVGTFYRSPSPDAPVYVNVGDKVKKGQTLGIIEAMKIMNEIEAEFDCQIIEILPSDGQPIEYGSPLFMVEKL